MPGGKREGVCKVLHIMSNASSSYKCDSKPGRGSRPPAFSPARLVAGSTRDRRSAGRRQLLQHQLGDGAELHVRGALVNLADFGIAPVFFDGKVFGESVSAIDFDSQGRDPLGDLRTEQL